MWAPLGRKKQLPGLTSLKKNSSWSCTKTHAEHWYMAWFLNKRFCMVQRYTYNKLYVYKKIFISFYHRAELFWSLPFISTDQMPSSIRWKEVGRAFAILLWPSYTFGLSCHWRATLTEPQLQAVTFWMPSCSYNGHNRDKGVRAPSLPAGLIGIRTWLL